MKKLNAGMNKDAAAVDQPEGTMRDALNANLNAVKGSIVNEYGTTEYVTNANFRVIGRSVLDDDRIVLFGKDVSGDPIEQIRILNPRNNQTVLLYENDSLNFKESHPIVCINRKNQANESLVYFTDGYVKEEEAYPGFNYVTENNPPRVINITKQEKFRFAGGLRTELYDTNNTYFKMDLIPRVGGHAVVDGIPTIQTGGVLESAAYYLALAYADKDGLETNYFYLANPVYVVPGAENVIPTNAFIGAMGGSPTNKSIKWKIKVPDTVDYELLQPAVIRMTGQEQTAFKLPARQINSSGSMFITFSGNENALPISPEDIIVDDVSYIAAESIAQLDNRLYLGNVTANKDIGFQPFAHNIQVHCVTENVEVFNPRAYDTFILNQGYASMLQTFDSNQGRQYLRQYTYDAAEGYTADPDLNNITPSYAALLDQYIRKEDGTIDKGYRDVNYSFKKKSYRRGEIYSFYISFVLKDGTETYAYHIPGRQALTIENSLPPQYSYYTADWKVIRFVAEEPGNASNTATYDLYFLFLNSGYAAVTESGYDWGFYRHGAADAYLNALQEASIVTPIYDESQHDSLPDIVYMPNAAFTDVPGDDEDGGGFVSQGLGDGGTFGSTAHGGADTANAMYDWLINHGPDLNGTSQEWKTATVQDLGFDSPTANIQQTAIQTDAPTGGQISEDDRLDSMDPDDIKTITGFRPEEFLQQHADAKVYQVIDTSYKADTNDSRFMGFWENENETYPNTVDFLVGGVTAQGEPQIDVTNTLAGENVRHHKFPSNLTPRSYVQAVEDTQSYYDEHAFRLFADGSGGNMSTVAGAGDNGGMILAETVRLMGIQLKGIKIPKYILNQVQGYKIYYAKRRAENKTILGQSIAIPGHPRYATVKEQSLEDAVKGPFKRAFYMYGGLDHSSDSSIDTFGDWKGNGTAASKRYFAHPVFKFHDFNMLRKRADVSSATHIQCQYGVMFRAYQGGPGMFVEPCDYNKLREVPLPAESPDYSVFGSTEFNNGPVPREDQYTTTFPSLGWVSPDMRNTVDFYWHDPLHIGEIQSEDKKLIGESRLLDISDTIEGEAGSDVVSEDPGVQDVKLAKRARMFRRGEDLSQPADLNEVYNDKIERLLACEAKAARVRAFFTSAMVATAYIKPASVLNNKHNIKAGDYKLQTIDVNSTPSVQTTPFLNRWYSEGEFDNNQLTLTLDPSSKILLNGKYDYESDDSTAFKGVSYLFNRAGETAFAFGLTSGLPALRGHLPYPENAINNGIDGPSRIDLTDWGFNHRWLYPDAAIEPIPLSYQRYGWGGLFFGDSNNGNLYPPQEYRGLRYSLSLSNQFNGHPMAWLVNVCSMKTDVYNPFERQELVWTGYYHPINNTNIETGAASDYEDNTTNYYIGADSQYIFGGDTYITRYSFRTTSQSYGHSYFRASPKYNDSVAGSLIYENALSTQDEGLGEYLTDAVAQATGRFQGDLPTNMDPSRTGENSDRFGTTNGVPIWNWARQAASNAADEFLEPYDAALNTLRIVRDTENWVKGNVNPVSTLFTFLVESDDLIEFRHIEDKETGNTAKVFDYHTARSIIFDPPTEDYTKPDRILYSEHFSGLQDMKVTFPLPIYEELAKTQTFPRRVVRSDVDSGSLADGYRKFRALEYKDIASQRGDIKSMFDYRGVLYIHTDRSLFLTQGKEELSIGAVNAFIGSGDIFTNDPSEVQESTIGYGGTTSRHCNVTTHHGHFYLNYRERKIYMAGGEGIRDITPGMETWLRDNMQFVVEGYGINLDSADAELNGFYSDATTSQSVPIGFTMGYDPLFKRILITKREPIPTNRFIEEFTAGNITIVNNIPYYSSEDCTDPTTDTENPDGEVSDFGNQIRFEDQEVICGPIWFGNPKYFTQGGWTISYYPDGGVWGSRHSYLPNLYAHTSEYMISFADDRSWEHTNKLNPGRFYGTTYNFEVEYIDNTAPADPKTYSNIYYWADSLQQNTSSLTQSNRITNTIFNEYYAYNSTQITGEPATINYLNNARLVDRVWYINELRDMARTEVITEGQLITGTQNVAGYITTGVTTHLQNTTMFTEEGVVNPNYVNISKEWYTRRKMVDHFLGVRLIHDNSNRNLVHLYAVGTKFRKSYR